MPKVIDEPGTYGRMVFYATEVAAHECPDPACGKLHPGGKVAFMPQGRANGPQTAVMIVEKASDGRRVTLRMSEEELSSMIGDAISALSDISGIPPMIAEFFDAVAQRVAAGVVGVVMEEMVTEESDGPTDDAPAC